MMALLSWTGVLCDTLLLIIAVSMTVMLECLAAFMIGFRKRQSFAVIACVDCITNPVASAVFVLISRMGIQSFFLWLAAVSLEVIVVFAEKQLFAEYIEFCEEPRVFRKSENNRKALLTSLVLNLVSAVPGSFLFRLIVDHIG